MLGPTLPMLSSTAAASEAPCLEPVGVRPAQAQQGGGTQIQSAASCCLQTAQRACLPGFCTSLGELGLCQDICTSPYSSSRGSELEGGRREAGVFPTWEDSPRPTKVTLTPTPAFHSYQIIAALLPTDLITLCTF